MNQREYYMIPEPVSLVYEQGCFTMTCDTEIVIDARCDERAFEYARLLRQTIEECTGLRMHILKSDFSAGKQGEAGASVRMNTVLLTVGSNRDGELSSNKEGYSVRIDNTGIVAVGNDSPGLFYAVQFLRQLVSQAGCSMPYLKAEDAPRFAIRGFFHDATRGRVGLVEYYKKLADRAAYYKLNMLQLYVEHTYMFRNFSEVWRDDTPLSAEDILELDAYCKKLNIELVPALATFSHLDKVLTTKSYAGLCELEGSENEEFSFISRMNHHTLNISDEGAWELVREMLDEFLPLFSSGFFNLCGDETFDLGKGKSKALAESIGVHRMYVNFVNRICNYLIEHGRRPMMWGDIISGRPELIGELPKEVVLLTWGYCENEHFHNSETVHNAGAVQIMCPGVHGWLRLMNRLRPAYENISRMVEYAGTYEGIGILNTDWGDYGHVSDPDFSVPGMIYGAQGAWHGSLDTFEEENRKISMVEFGDRTGRIVGIIGELADCEAFSWAHVCQLEEYLRTEHTIEDIREFIRRCGISEPVAKNERIDLQISKLAELSVLINASGRERIYSYMLHAKGQQLLNMTGFVLAVRKFGMKAKEFGSPDQPVTGHELASKLEKWLVSYRENWRMKSRESELYRVSNVIYHYADMLRDID